MEFEEEGYDFGNFPAGPLSSSDSHIAKIKQLVANKNIYGNDNNFGIAPEDTAMMKRFQSMYDDSTTINEEFTAGQSTLNSLPNAMRAWDDEDKEPWVGGHAMNNSTIEDQYKATRGLFESTEGDGLGAQKPVDPLRLVNQVETESDYDALHKTIVNAYRKELPSLTQKKGKRPGDKAPMSILKDIPMAFDNDRVIESRTPFLKNVQKYAPEERIDPITLAGLEYGINSKYMVSTDEDLTRMVTAMEAKTLSRAAVRLVKESEQSVVPTGFYDYDYLTDDPLIYSNKIGESDPDIYATAERSIYTQ